MNKIALFHYQSFILFIILKHQLYVHLLNGGIPKIITRFKIIIIGLNLKYLINILKFF